MSSTTRDRLHDAHATSRRCEHPGCDLPVGWCAIDHNNEWNDGGRNYTIRDDGTIILPVGARNPKFEADPDDAWYDDPDETKRLANLARERVRALHPDNDAA